MLVFVNYHQISRKFYSFSLMKIHRVTKKQWSKSGNKVHRPLFAVDTDRAQPTFQTAPNIHKSILQGDYQTSKKINNLLNALLSTFFSMSCLYPEKRVWIRNFEISRGQAVKKTNFTEKVVTDELMRSSRQR